MLNTEWCTSSVFLCRLFQKLYDITSHPSYFFTKLSWSFFCLKHLTSVYSLLTQLLEWTVEWWHLKFEKRGKSFCNNTSGKNSCLIVISRIIVKMVRSTYFLKEKKASRQYQVFFFLSRDKTRWSMKKAILQITIEMFSVTGLLRVWRVTGRNNGAWWETILFFMWGKLIGVEW